MAPVNLPKPVPFSCSLVARACSVFEGVGPRALSPGAWRDAFKDLLTKMTPLVFVMD